MGECDADATWQRDVTLWQFEEKIDEYWEANGGVALDERVRLFPWGVCKPLCATSGVSATSMRISVPSVVGMVQHHVGEVARLWRARHVGIVRMVADIGPTMQYPMRTFMGCYVDKPDGCVEYNLEKHKR
ncbi:UNVERIFIED_CONTAM: hypothetical protein Sindi_2489300 [Sesamum indicum]